jgi:formiminotetrahydrofolate cyclodeaminase
MDFTQQNCGDFITLLASKEPVPGGGGASALVGAVGTALGNMVGSLTLGKKKYAGVQAAITELKAKADKLQDEFLALIARDAEVFEPLSRAYGLPTGTDEQKKEKAQVMEAALKEASSVPLSIMEKCGTAIVLLEEFEIKGTTIAISDVGCGAVCCKAALEAASLNVLINTKSMMDRNYAEAINEKVKNLLRRYRSMADEIYARVAARFGEVG